MEQTVIRTFTSKYINLMMDKVVWQEDVAGFLAKLTLKDAVPMMDEAWQSVQASTMKKSWYKLLT